MRCTIPVKIKSQQELEISILSSDVMPNQFFRGKNTILWTTKDVHYKVCAPRCSLLVVRSRNIDNSSAHSVRLLALEACLPPRLAGKISLASAGPSTTSTSGPTLSAEARWAASETCTSTRVLLPITSTSPELEARSARPTHAVFSGGGPTTLSSESHTSSAGSRVPSIGTRRRGAMITPRTPNRSRTPGRSPGRTRAAQA